MNIDQGMLPTFNDEPDLHKEVITGDESWVYDYDIESKNQPWQRKAIGDTKKRISEVFRGLEKTLA